MADEKGTLVSGQIKSEAGKKPEVADTSRVVEVLGKRLFTCRREFRTAKREAGLPEDLGKVEQSGSNERIRTAGSNMSLLEDLAKELNLTEEVSLVARGEEFREESDKRYTAEETKRREESEQT